MAGMTSNSTTPRLLALGTAVPPHALRQEEVRERAARLFAEAGGGVERLLPVFENAGIVVRYSCVPIDWYQAPHGWRDRNRLYLDHALALLDRVARDCLDQAGLKPSDIDALVVVSTTGIATPSLDAPLVGRLGLRANVERLPIFGLGCAGGVLGLARAAALARAAPDSRVMFLAVELCALTFRKNDLSKSNIVATALFGDGAAGAILSCRGDGPRLGASGEHIWPDSLDIMGWDVEEDGLKAIFSRDIPTLVRSHMREIATAFLARHGLALDDIDGFVCHPGGTKVLAALEEAFGIGAGSLGVSRDVLRNYGNMSAVTVLFVLNEVLKAGTQGRLLMTAMGPGFTAAFLLLDTR
jgi:alkylresorcinol/alkylpyrone synthase